MMRLRKLFTIISLGLVSFFISGCLSTNPTVQSSGDDIQSVRNESYNGPKARLAIIDFKNKTRNSGYRAGFGQGMADMLTTSLVNTNRFIILERKELRAIEKERRKFGRKKTKLEDADIMVTASVTEWDPGSSGMKASKGFSGLLSSVTGSFKKSHVAIDLRLIDVDTGRIISATSVSGKASSFGGGAKSYGMRGGLSGYQKTPMEAAIRQLIQAASDYVGQRTPKKYYRFK